MIYLLKSLNKTKKNYEIHDKKISTVIRGLKVQGLDKLQEFRIFHKGIKIEP